MLNPLWSFIRRATPALMIVAFLAGCTLPTSASDGGAPGVQIVQPQEGAQFDAGETISVISTFSDPGGAQGMILEVNGVAVRDDKFHSPMFQGRMDQPWSPAQNGPATLCVYLSTSSGQLLRSNCVTVTIGSASRPTSTPWVTFTPTTELTSTPTLTVTPGVPTVTATQDSNCRLGPDTAYGVRSSLLTGQTAPIVGRSADSSWWVIQITGGGECWIWGEIVTVTGDTSQVPVVTPPPLPTATFTQTAPLSAPTPISPSGILNCAQASGGVILKWSAVTHPNGISRYEWELVGPISDSGSVAGTQASTKTLSCAGAVYQWRVRAVDGLGNIGPWSAYMQFNVP